MMKKKLLKGSAASLIVAVTVSICTAIFAKDPEAITRVSAVAFKLYMASIGLWAIGLITPKEIE